MQWELQHVLSGLLAQREDVHVLGQDLLDPYGGAFKVTDGLSTRFPNRVWTTPVSEAATVGMANGMALAGLRPVVEIMFGDFSTLIVDQLLNHAAKFERMYGGTVRCPVIVRTPMGGHRGYGPTHSQSLEKLFLGIPGLTVVAADPVHDQRLIWQRMIELGALCLYVENKALYGTRLPLIEAGRWGPFTLEASTGFFPTTRFSLGGPPDAAIVCYGGMVPAVLEAARRLFERYEWVVDAVAERACAARCRRARPCARFELSGRGRRRGHAAFRFRRRSHRRAGRPPRTGQPHDSPARDAGYDRAQQQDAGARAVTERGPHRGSAMRTDSVTSESNPLLAPRVSANDDTVVVRTWFVAHGAWVEPDTVIAEIETSKAIVEVRAERAGFLAYDLPEGGEVGVGDPLGWLMADPDAQPLARQRPQHLADGRLISFDAAALMTERGLTAADIPGLGAVRALDVRHAIAARENALVVDDWQRIVDALPNHAGATLIFGGDAQGAVVYECLESMVPGTAVVYVDDAPKRATLMGLPVLPASALDAVRRRGIKCAHVSVAAAKAKLRCVQRLLEAGYEMVGVRHATALVSPSATIGSGVFLGPLTLVGPNARIGNYAQINNTCSVAHDSVVGEAARLSDGVRLAGSVVVGDGAYLGLGVTVNGNVTIGPGSTVVSGVSVFDHVPAASVVRIDGKAYPLR